MDLDLVWTGNDKICLLVKNAARSGQAVVRSMEYEFPHQGYHQIKDQFMLGPSILVAPILEQGATKRSVTLPKGTWKYKGTTYRGGRNIEIGAGISDIPIFRKM